MKILRISVASFLLLTTVVSCGGNGNKATANVSTENSTPNEKLNKVSETKSDTLSVDLSTPTKAVESFISSSIAQNMDNLSLCFSSNCEREFQMIVKKEMKEKDLKEFKEFCLGAKVINEKIEGKGALVEVKFSRRDEKITLELVEDKWKILSF
jgi:hypothetical protein